MHIAKWRRHKNKRMRPCKICAASGRTLSAEGPAPPGPCPEHLSRTVPGRSCMDRRGPTRSTSVARLPQMSLLHDIDRVPRRRLPRHDAPGSDLFVVFDTGYFAGDLMDPYAHRWTRRTGVVKLTYLKAF